MKLSRVAEWEIAKHMAIELFPFNLKAQQKFIRNRMVSVK
jgi:hypothetical protein